MALISDAFPEFPVNFFSDEVRRDNVLIERLYAAPKKRAGDRNQTEFRIQAVLRKNMPPAQ